MADDTARAVGAGSTTTVTIAGKECALRPLTIRELLEAERDCLSRYKREYIKTFVENADLLSKEKRDKIVADRMGEAARWDIDNLPPKYSYDPTSIILTENLKEWIKIQFTDAIDDEDYLCRLVTAVLDQGTLSEEQYEELTGKVPSKVKVGYVNWWITASYEGMTTMVWLCLRRDGITREQVVEELSKRPDMLINLSREVETLSTPELGNG